MADARNETAWNSQVTRSELKSGEPIGQGSTFATVNRGREYVATISRYEKPGLLVFEVTGKPMDITATFRFRPEGEQTGFGGEVDMRPKGFMKVALPRLRPHVRR